MKQSPFKGLKILVCGESGVDSYTRFSSLRHSPEAPVPVLIDGDTFITKMGLAGNVVENIRALGAEADLYTVCGMDAMGDWMIENSKGGYFIRDSSRPTIEKIRLFSNGSQLARIDIEKTHSVSGFVEDSYERILRDNVDRYDAVILQDYGKGLWTERLLNFIRDCNKPVFVDPFMGRNADVYKGAYLIKPNEAEARSITGYNSSYSIVEMAKSIQRQTGAEVTITCGSSGIASAETFYLTYQRNPVDVNGCGDTVLSVLTLMTLKDKTLEDSIYLANVAAGIKVSQPLGQATVSWKELFQ